MSEGFHLHWLLPDRVIYACLHHQLDGLEPEAIDRQLVEMIRAGKPPVYLIMDLREITEMRSPSVRRMTEVDYRSEPNLQWMLILTNDKLMKFLAGTASQMSHKSFAIYHDMAELQQFMQRQFPEYDWGSLLTCAGLISSPEMRVSDQSEELNP